MAVLQIIYGYKPIFKQKADAFEAIDEKAKQIAYNMLDTMYYERAVGIGANMVGILKKVAVIDLFENQQKNPLVLFNPTIYEKSIETQKFEEASISFPGISAIIERPSQITVNYQNLNGDNISREFSGFLSTVIQHEMDYLEGVTIFDHMSKLKRETLIKKMEKHLNMHPPHVHSASCSHNH